MNDEKSAAQCRADAIKYADRAVLWARVSLLLALVAFAFSVGRLAIGHLS